MASSLHDVYDDSRKVLVERKVHDSCQRASIDVHVHMRGYHFMPRIQAKEWLIALFNRPTLLGAARPTPKFDSSTPELVWVSPCSPFRLTLRSNLSMTTSVMKRAWKHRRAAAGGVLYWSGLAYIFEGIARPTGAIIVTYHSVAAVDAEFVDPPMHLAPSLFEKQMAFLRKHRHVVSLSALVAQIEAGETPTAGTVCITFDDGYLDTLTVAAPILERYQLPATVYLATSYIDRAQSQWADVAHWIFRCRTGNRLEFSADGLAFDLDREDQYLAARSLLQTRLLESTYAARSELLTELERQLRPTGSMPRLTMNWDEVRDLMHRFPLFEIGGHSRDHIDLRAHRGEAARGEIAGCASDLQRELGRDAQHFSFPYGRWSTESLSFTKDAGWRSAVGSSVDYRVGALTNRHLMARVETPLSMTALRFMTSGAFPGAFAMLGKD